VVVSAKSISGDPPPQRRAPIDRRPSRRGVWIAEAYYRLDAGIEPARVEAPLRVTREIRHRAVPPLAKPFPIKSLAIVESAKARKSGQRKPVRAGSIGDGAIDAVHGICKKPSTFAEFSLPE